MSLSRRCTKTSCGAMAVATLTYAYADRAVVVGPLATLAEPHSYDLCAEHATRLTAPRGWDVVRLSSEGYVPVDVSDTDDLLAVVEAVRERPVRPLPTQSQSHPPAPGLAPAPDTSRRRGHLRVLPGLDEI